MNFPSEEIIFRMKQGDETAFGQLCAYFRLPAMKFCLALLKNEVESEIVILETFEKIWEERVQVKCGKTFQEILFVQLRSQIFDRFKKMGTNKTGMETYLKQIAQAQASDKNMELIA